jgi:hypothetical protein
MRIPKVFFLGLSVAAVLGGATAGVLAWRQAVDAHSLDKVLIEPAPPQAPAPSEEIPVDPRLESLLPREDGARLLWAPGPGEHLAAAGFSDNGTLNFSTSSTDNKAPVWRVYSLAISSGTPVVLESGSAARLVSGNRSAHRNAGRLCYSKQADSGIFDVWCSNLDGLGEKQVTVHDGKEDLISPTISPDGSWLAFEVNSDRSAKSGKPLGSAAQQPHGSSTIWKIGLNGGDIQQLTRGGDDRHPSWSDDGKKIYFQRRMPDGNWDIFSMEADGTQPTPILRTTDVDEMFPVRRAATDDFLMVVASASTTPRLKLLDSVTKSGSYPTGGIGPETWPSISPDGKLASFLAPTDPANPDSLGIWLLQLEN